MSYLALDEPCLREETAAASSSKLLFKARFCSSNLSFSILSLSVSRSCSTRSRSRRSRSSLARSRSIRFTSSRSLKKKINKMKRVHLHRIHRRDLRTAVVQTGLSYLISWDFSLFRRNLSFLSLIFSSLMKRMLESILALSRILSLSIRFFSFCGGEGGVRNIYR